MLYMLAEHAQAVVGNGSFEKVPADLLSLVDSSKNSPSQKGEEVATNLEGIRKEMEAMKIVIEKQV